MGGKITLELSKEEYDALRFAIDAVEEHYSGVQFAAQDLETLQMLKKKYLVEGEYNDDRDSDDE